MKKVTQRQSHKSTYRPEIDGLRAIAVMAVVLFHAFPKKLHGGFVGVDIFFVISGFLITSILIDSFETQTYSLKDFYSRRVKRIFPALILVLFACFIVGFQLMPADFKMLGKHILGGGAFSSNLILWSEAGYFDSSSELKPLLHLWSLGVEEQFYIVWPIALWLIWRAKKNAIRTLLIPVLLSFFYCLYTSYHEPTNAFYLPYSRFWEIGVGGLWAIAEKRNIRLVERVSEKIHVSQTVTKDVLSWLGLALIVYAVYRVSERSVFPGLAALLPTCGTLSLIIAGSNSSLSRLILSRKLFVGIGLISYPLYLWHWPAMAFVRILAYDKSEVQTQYLLEASVGLSLILAYGTYVLVEKPLKNFKNDFLKVTILCLLMLFVCVLGFGAYVTDGFVYRLPPEIGLLTRPINFKFSERARFGICHYDRGESKIAKVGASECVDSKSPKVLIWGDSYTAALYPGLKKLQESKSFGIVQATECGTPPIEHIDWDNGCTTADQMNNWNRDVRKLISEIKPEVIILHAFWQGYNNSAWEIEQAQKTIITIKSLSPKSKIIVLGSVPMWGSYKDGLPLWIYRYWKTYGRNPPEYMTLGLSNTSRPEPPDTEEKFKDLGAKFISPFDILCKQGACLTRVGPLPTDLTAIDQGHLSGAASEYLINNIQEQLFSQ